MRGGCAGGGVGACVVGVLVAGVEDGVVGFVVIADAGVAGGDCAVACWCWLLSRYCCALPSWREPLFSQDNRYRHGRSLVLVEINILSTLPTDTSASTVHPHAPSRRGCVVNGPMTEPSHK